MTPKRFSACCLRHPVADSVALILIGITTASSGASA